MAGPLDASTAGKMLYGRDGYVDVGGVSLGATLGDITFEMKAVEYYPEIAQALGPVAGTGRIIGATGQVKVTLAEWAYAKLSTLFSMGTSSDAQSETVGGGSVGTITELSNVRITGITRNDNKPFLCTITSCRVTSPLGATLAPNKETGLEVVFEALFSATAPKVFPMKIQFGV